MLHFTVVRYRPWSVVRSSSFCDVVIVGWTDVLFGCTSGVIGRSLLGPAPDRSIMRGGYAACRSMDTTLHGM